MINRLMICICTHTNIVLKNNSRTLSILHRIYVPGKRINLSSPFLIRYFLLRTSIVQTLDLIPITMRTMSVIRCSDEIAGLYTYHYASGVP